MSEQVQAQNVAVWFEIPAVNFERASGFYEAILSTKLDRHDYQGRAMGVFPHVMGQAVSGCVMEDPDHVASTGGTTVYLNCPGRLEEVADRVERAGGRVLTPRIDLPNDGGSFYQIADSEGNRVGLYAA